MDTYFSPPDKSAGDELAKEIASISNNQIMDAILTTTSGLFAVLNTKRQILAVNKDFLSSLGIRDEKEIIGYRLGETIKCINANSFPNGCGTTLNCTTCGAAIAIASSIQYKNSFDGHCVVKRKEKGVESDLMFHIKSSYVKHGDQEYILVFLRDVSREQQLSALESIFFHDINNIISTINVAVELVTPTDNSDKMLNIIKRGCSRLKKEIEMQECLSKNIAGTYMPHLEKTTISDILTEIYSFIKVHNSCDGKRFLIEANNEDADLYTDRSVVLRVLTNMVINALEATDYGEKVRMWVTRNTDNTLTFSVHNITTIPHEDAQRIFQRNFSTKSNIGRGLGTYSMKLFGEEILGGSVEFTSNQEDGTTFNFTIAERYEE